MTANYPEADHIYPAFAVMLDNMVLEEQNRPLNTLIMVCQSCSEEVCEVEPNDTMRTLLNTALAHKCPPPVSPKKNRR